MYIGIDETGDFVSNNLNFFISIFIRYKYLNEIEILFKKWEKSLPKDSRNLTGEVKGHLLSDEILYDFIDKIIYNNFYQINYCCYGVETNQNSWNHIDLQRKMTITQITSAIEEYRKKGKKYFKIANQYSNMLDWYKNQSKQNTLKMAVLGTTISDSLNHAICFSAVNSFDDELEFLQFKIDQDFISKGAKNIYWKEILRNQLWSRHGITRIKEWDKNHPFLRIFVEEENGHKLILTNELKNRINFYNSRFSFEIRIADIISTINRKYITERKCKLSFNKLRQLNFSKGLYTHLILTMSKNPVPNPYK